MLFHAISHRYDRVFVQQLSPVMMSAPGVLYKRLRKVSLYTWVLDLWPESLTAAGGIFEESDPRVIDDRRFIRRLAAIQRHHRSTQWKKDRIYRLLQEFDKL